jgi:hypothetical protein
MKRLELSAAVRPGAVAALVPLKNVGRESLALSQHPEFLGLIGRAEPSFLRGAPSQWAR